MASPRTKQNQTLIDLVKIYQENLSGDIETFATLLMRYQVEYKKEWVKLDEVKACMTVAINEGLDPIVEHVLASGFPTRTLLQDPNIGSNPDKREEKNLLYFAAKGGHLSIVRLLIEKYRVDPKDSMGMDGAVLGGHTQIAQYFLKNGANANEYILGYDSNPNRDDLTLPYLTIAALQQQHDMIELLIDHGAMIGKALAWAHQYFRVKRPDHEQYRTILQTIMDYAQGCDFEPYTRAKTYPYFSGVSLANVNMMGVSFDGKCATREFFFENKFIDAQQAILTDEDKNHLKNEKQQARLTNNLSKAIKQYGELKTPDGIYNMVPLHIAAKNDLEAVKVRLKAGVDPQSIKIIDDIRSIDYKKCDQFPIIVATKNNQIEIVKMLANHPNIDPALLYESAKIALHEKYDGITKWLLTLEKLPAIDKEEKTLLHHASSLGNLEMVKYLITQAQFPIDALDKYNRSAIFYAAGSRHQEIAIFLLQNGARKDSKDIYNKSILDFMHGEFKEIKYRSYTGIYSAELLYSMEQRMDEIAAILKNYPKKSPLITQRQQWMSSTQENAVLDNAADVSPQEETKGMQIK